MKISAAILDYAKPVLDVLPHDAPLETQREALSFAICVWNALVIFKWGRPEFLTEIRERLSTSPNNDLVTGVLDALIERKRLRYANDDRAVGNWELRLKHDGSTALWAEARGARN